MLIRPFLVAILLPPVSLIPAVVLGLALLRRWPRLGRWVIGLSAALLLFLALPVVPETLIAALEHNLPLTPPPDNPPQAIVILGAEVARTDGTVPGTTVGRMTLERVRAGAALYRRTHLPILVSGGVIGNEGPPVAALMAQSLMEDFQVPVRWIEPNSQDTWQNAADSAALLRAAGIRSVYVVTTAWHERRAMIAFAPTGIAATAAPDMLDRPPKLRLDDLVPHASALLLSYFALHEWIGCAWYALR